LFYSLLMVPMEQDSYRFADKLWRAASGSSLPYSSCSRLSRPRRGDGPFRRTGEFFVGAVVALGKRAGLAGPFHT
jgi:hypothetical protein